MCTIFIFFKLFLYCVAQKSVDKWKKFAYVKMLNLSQWFNFHVQGLNFRANADVQNDGPSTWMQYLTLSQTSTLTFERVCGKICQMTLLIWSFKSSIDAGRAWKTLFYISQRKKSRGVKSIVQTKALDYPVQSIDIHISNSNCFQQLEQSEQ